MQASKEFTNRHLSEDEDNNLYFAYGSNLNKKDLKDWARINNKDYPLKDKVSLAYLPDNRLIFNHYSTSRKGGALNIVESPEDKVHGVLFEVKGEEGWESLDKKEGHPYAYERTKVKVFYGQGDKPVTAITYVKKNKMDDLHGPKCSYIKVLLKGYKNHGLNVGPVKKAIKAIAEAKAKEQKQKSRSKRAEAKEASEQLNINI